MRNGTIVDSRSINEETLLMEYFMSPYFAWGLEYIVATWSPSLGWIVQKEI